MSESTTAVAVESSAPATQSIEMPRSGTAEYAEWRVTGETPKVQPKSEVAATSDPSKETIPDAGESETPRQQERTGKGKGAEHRIKELLSRQKALEAEIQTLKTPKTESKPVQQQPQNYPEWRKTFNASKWVEEYAKQNPTSYEDANAAMADYLGDVRETFKARTSQQEAEQREILSKVDEARSRYENFDEVLQPTVTAILSDPSVSPSVKAMLNDSDVLPDLIFTIGSDAKDLQAFIQMAKNSPGKALRYIAHVETLIQEELSVKPSTGRDAAGKFTAPEPTAPAKRGPESVPEPPLEIGNRGAGTMDEAQRALSAIANGDSNAVRAWIKAENAKDMRRRRGA
jgi:hypothetical protein